MINKNIKKILPTIITILFVAINLLPVFAMAQGGVGNNPGGQSGSQGSSGGSSMAIKIANPFKQSSIQGLIETVIKEILMPIGIVISVLMIMYAGFKYVTARGDSTKIKEATTALTYAAIGAAVLLGAWVISQAIQGTINQFRV